MFSWQPEGLPTKQGNLQQGRSDWIAPLKDSTNEGPQANQTLIDLVAEHFGVLMLIYLGGTAAGSITDDGEDVCRSTLR